MGRLSEPQFPPFLGPLVERSVRESCRKAQAQGFAEGWQQGFHDGGLTGARTLLLRLLDRAGLPVSAEEHARIVACTVIETLNTWALGVLHARTTADVLGKQSSPRDADRLSPGCGVRDAGGRR